MVDNPFAQASATWQLELIFTHSNPDLVLDFLEDISLALDVDIDGERVKVIAYLAEEANLVELSGMLSGFMDDGGQIISLTQTPVADNDWVSQVQAEFQPFVTKYLQVVPYGCESASVLGKQQIILKPGRAFGNSEHATTQLCTLGMEELYDAGIRAKRILDLGTGTGILAIAAHKLWPESKVTAVDIDQEAVNAAKENVEFNDASGFIDVAITENVPASPNQQKFDLIVANILLEPLTYLASYIKASLAEEGRVILSGILSTQVPDLAEVYKQAGMEVYKVDELEGWSRVTLRHMIG